MTTTPDHIQVFFLNPGDGWATAEFDAESNQLGEAVCSYRKAWAIKEARAMAGGTLPIRIFGRGGLEQRTINEATK